MTHYKIAKCLGISEAAVSKWYSGKNMPNSKNLIRLSKLLGKDEATLLREFSKKKAKK